MNEFIAIQKWNQKKEQLDKLYTHMAQDQKTNSRAINKLLKSVMKENNFNVVQSGVRIIGLLFTKQ